MAKVVVLEECGSTNIEAADKCAYGHGDAVIAWRQTAGRGQRGRRWESVPGENLTFSVVLEPCFLKASEQFLLSEAVALALTDTLLAYGVEARIKWTNDIYVGDRKICGILIEHDLKEQYLSRSVIGIGLNVNQRKFPDWLPNPDSISLETGIKYDVTEVFETLYANLMARYETLASGNGAAVERDYSSLLYRRDQLHRYFIPDEGEVMGTIRSVSPTGVLTVEIEGAARGFLFKEIEFII